MTKTIDTIVDDIYDVFLNTDHVIDEVNLEKLGDSVKAAVVRAVTEAGVPRENNLRMSAIGTPDRKLYYKMHKNNTDDVLSREKYMMFLYGHILEALLIFFCEEAGHVLTHDQEELEVEGVLGHCDPVIDGVVADIKSASGFSYRTKFAGGALLRGDDPFGYIGQLSGYREALIEKYPDEIDKEKVAWLVINKENGEICLLEADTMDLINAEDRIRHIKKFLKEDQPPVQKCYPDQPDGSSGNRVLHKSCTYCPFKFTCWSENNGGLGLRTFKYSNGTRYFTNVAKLPRVEELT